MVWTGSNLTPLETKAGLKADIGEQRSATLKFHMVVRFSVVLIFWGEIDEEFICELTVAS